MSAEVSFNCHAVIPAWFSLSTILLVAFPNSIHAASNEIRYNQIQVHQSIQEPGEL